MPTSVETQPVFFPPDVQSFHKPDLRIPLKYAPIVELEYIEAFRRPCGINFLGGSHELLGIFQKAAAILDKWQMFRSFHDLRRNGPHIQVKLVMA